ncbi:farnesol dehydrogenase-like [Ctenocephalides felis]|uniref:farnesol dehydrogenase-like n=1 Tax=Ctenocephalides felis TaxID=7515 RepID=UPI000E6E3AD8|nr:farnesol dehydrogenase-like [Ctenocephalides felis]
MDRWQNKVAVVTGACSGIGQAVAKDLLKAGMKVIGLDIKATKNEQSTIGELYLKACDISKEGEVIESFKWVRETFGGVDVLVNCAGIVRKNMLTNPGNAEDLRKVLDINVLGLCFCTREAFNSMKERDVAGHIIHINSLYGHSISANHNTPPTMNMYPASKYCVTALTELLRQEMMYLQSKTKVTSISPGVVNTGILNDIVPEPDRKEFFNQNPHLQPEDISQAIMYCLSTPEHVQVHELTIRPIGDKF